MVPPFPGQGEFDIFSILLPIICCLLAMLVPLGQSGGGAQPGPAIETDLWYTIQDIKEAYKSIKREVTEWRKDAIREEEKPKTLTIKLRNFFRGGRKGERFVVKEEVAPRLYKLTDKELRTISFELIKVEGGGTTVKTTYHPRARDLIHRFKAHSPLMIPATPIGKHCPSCGKPVLGEFAICPYCGQKLIKA